MDGSGGWGGSELGIQAGSGLLKLKEKAPAGGRVSKAEAKPVQVELPQLARAQPHLITGSPPFADEVGGEERRIVGREGDRDAGGKEAGKRMGRHGRHDFEALIAGEGDIAADSPLCKQVKNLGIFRCPYTVLHAAHTKIHDGLAYVHGAPGFPRVGHNGVAGPASAIEPGSKIASRQSNLGPSKPQGDNERVRLLFEQLNCIRRARGRRFAGKCR